MTDMTDTTNFDEMLDEGATEAVAEIPEPQIDAAALLEIDEDPVSILDEDQKTPAQIKRKGLFTSIADKAAKIDKEVTEEFDLNDDDNDDWKSKIARTDKGAISKSMFNINLIMANDPRIKGVLAHNEFTHTICQVRDIKTKMDGTEDVLVEDAVNGDPLDDKQVDVIRAILSAPGSSGGYDITVTENDTRAGIRGLARMNSFHPVKRYLEKQIWDGKGRVETLFVDWCGATDNRYTREVALMTLIAAVTRIYEPGHKFDFIPILESRVQGFGKSTFVRCLAEGFFAEMLDVDMHDTTKQREKMIGAWILEIPELIAMKGRDAGKLKAFLSSQSDKARMAYDRGSTEVKRQAIFFGTVDRSEYLDDPAGNRRYWPIKCGTKSIDLKAFKDNVGQIWAEAVQLYKHMRELHSHGDLPLYLQDEEAVTISKKVQKSKLVSSAVEEWKDDIKDMADDICAFDADLFSDKMHTRVALEDGTLGMRLKFFSLRYAWLRIGNDVGEWNPRTQQHFAAAIAHLPGIDKGDTPQKKILPSFCDKEGHPGDDKSQRYYVVDHNTIKPSK